MMISYPDDKLKIIEVYCGELCKTDECSSSELNLINKQIGDLEPNIVIDFDKFVRNPENLPPRIVDLLYIAACVYCADRMMHRGERESLSNNAWARSFNFHIAVSDFDFWIDSKVQKALNDALTFMTGPDGVHLNNEKNLTLKREFQRRFEQTHTRQEFRETFGKSYIMEDEE